jgi:hypothetical protein
MVTPEVNPVMSAQQEVIAEPQEVWPCGPDRNAPPSGGVCFGVFPAVTSRRFPNTSSYPWRTSMKETSSPLHEDTPDTTLIDLAQQTSELAVASASVLDLRTRQMADAGLTPNARDHQEFALMGQEKMDAAVESTQAMIAGMLAMQQWLVHATLQQLSSSAAAVAALFTTKTPADLVEAQATLASERLANFQSAGEKAAAYLTSTAAQGLHPVHSRATANARRLANINVPSDDVTGQG